MVIWQFLYVFSIASGWYLIIFIPSCLRDVYKAPAEYIYKQHNTSVTIFQVQKQTSSPLFAAMFSLIINYFVLESHDALNACFIMGQPPRLVAVYAFNVRTSKQNRAHFWLLSPSSQWSHLTDSLPPFTTPIVAILLSDSTLHALFNKREDLCYHNTSSALLPTFRQTAVAAARIKW